jgi:hypothetical protein
MLAAAVLRHQVSCSAQRLAGVLQFFFLARLNGHVPCRFNHDIVDYEIIMLHGEKIIIL